MFQISIDTGGTFTDGVLLHEDGTISTAKVPTTPDEPTRGVMDCVKLLASSENGLTTNEMLARTQSFTLGTTVGTNAVLQLKGAKVGMITTKGYRDVLEMRRVVKPDLFNMKLPKPVILVPRYLRFVVDERMRYNGEVITPLNEAEARQVIARIKARGVEVIAVCFLHSYINPAHERRMAEIIKEEYPGVGIVLSSTISPRPMEFERFNTTVLAAYISPLCSAFLRDLDIQLKKAGFGGALLAMTSNAGVTTAEVAEERPILMVSSGPSAGVLFASVLAKQAGVNNIISTDMGGTSFDVSVLPEGRILTTTEGMIGDQRNACETIDVVSIGAGGGSIAWLDQRGVLYVGPESAGAYPGPACYGKEGRKPTVTDADVILGYIPADYFLGGKIKLEADLARQAIEENIGKPMGKDVIEAAYAIKSMVDFVMAEEVFMACTSRGYDPRDFVICCGGGAGPAHIFDIARRLHIKEVYIPKAASVFCAYGMVSADFKHETSRFVRYEARNADINELGRIYREMEKEQIALLKREGVPREAIRIRRGGEVQYYGQAFAIDAWMSEKSIDAAVTRQDLEELIEDFHTRHGERYGYVDRSLLTELAGVKLVATGLKHKPGIPVQSASGEDTRAALKRQRPVYFQEAGGFAPTPCYDGDKLRHGNIISGPAIVEEKMTTVVIPPGVKIFIDRFGNYRGSLA